jgi:hypothetical protein
MMYREIITVLKPIQNTWQNVEFLGAFAKLPKTTGLRHVCPSFVPHGTTLLTLDGVCEILYLNIFRKSVEKIEILLKSGKNNG